MLSIPVANGPLGDFGGSAAPIPNARVSALSLEHHDLDSAIDALVGAKSCDDLMVARLKKRRLQIRDEIAGILAAAQTGEAPGAAVFHDAAHSDERRTRAAAPGTASGAFGFGLMMTLLTLFMLVLGWSGMVDSVNQTMAQIYILSLVAAANG